MASQIPQQIEDAIYCLQELCDDADCGKSLKLKAASVLSLLKKDDALSVEKALFELEGFNSADISPYLRTRIWDIISLLESCHGN